MLLFRVVLGYTIRTKGRANYYVDGNNNLVVPPATGRRTNQCVPMDAGKQLSTTSPVHTLALMLDRPPCLRRYITGQ